jgi:hypothetical protein
MYFPPKLDGPSSVAVIKSVQHKPFGTVTRLHRFRVRNRDSTTVPSTMGGQSTYIETGHKFLSQYRRSQRKGVIPSPPLTKSSPPPGSPAVTFTHLPSEVLLTHSGSPRQLKGLKATAAAIRSLCVYWHRLCSLQARSPSRSASSNTSTTHSRYNCQYF